MKDKFSIIIPIYNAELTLKRCLDSIKRQSYRKFEVILIDDGSKDKSLSIAKEFAKNDPRFIVFHQENNGVSSARNKGIDNAKGDFVIFVDSDDEIREGMLHELLDIYRQTDSNLIIASYSASYNYKNKWVINDTLIETGTFSLSEMKIKIIEENIMVHINGLWSKCFDLSLLNENKIRFNVDLDLGEDTCFVLEYMNIANIIATINKPLYFGHATPGGLSHKDRKDIWKNQKLLSQLCSDFYKNECKNLYDKAKSFFWFRGISISINTAISYHWSRTEYISLCEEIVSYPKFLEIKKLNSKYKNLVMLLLKNRFFMILRYVLIMKNMYVYYRRKANKL